ncbi:MAG: glycosyl transferase [Aliarcobacter sp.]|jgi:anthranilate phosphoribosyltransferase|nr:glycosyl transferase [Aliarcobacter sp.]
MGFHSYIRAVGTGPKSNRELTKIETIDAIESILNQNVHSEQIAAFLLGWRVRLETVEELKTTLEVCNRYIKKVKIDNSIELGYPFDGKADNPYLLPLIAKYLKKFDLNLVVSGDELQPAKKGLTIKKLYENVDFDDNIYYFDRADYFKELSNLTRIRNILGLRTAFNTIEKLLNPGSSDYAVNAAFHKPYVSKYNQIFENYKNLIIVKGNEGTPEIFSKCKYWLTKDGEISEYIIDPEYFGINYKKSTNIISPEESLNMTRNPSDELAKLAKLNAAMFLIAAQKADDIKTAFEMIE